MDERKLSHLESQRTCPELSLCEFDLRLLAVLRKMNNFKVSARYLFC